MPTNNLFWSQYQTLEKEFLKSTRFITFDDNNLEVYSEQFIDILMRTWVEIETISKKLYFDNGGQLKTGDALYFDTDCIAYLDHSWCLCDKIVHVDHINFYFSRQDMVAFKPLYKCNKRGTSGSKWKQAYQSVKHDRMANYKKANLMNCLKSLGALYLLNIYLKELSLKNVSLLEKEKIDFHLGSEMFVASVDEDLSSSPRNPKSESLLCVRINEEQRKRINDSINQANENIVKRVVDEIQRTVNERGVEANVQGQIDEVLKAINTKNIQIQEIKKTNVFREFNNLRVDIYLNK